MKCYLDNLIIGTIRSNYINLNEIMYTYAAKKIEKREQPVSTAVFDASYLRLV
jgi:hypothetical protein